MRIWLRLRWLSIIVVTLLTLPVGRRTRPMSPCLKWENRNINTLITVQIIQHCEPQKHVYRANTNSVKQINGGKNIELWYIYNEYTMILWVDEYKIGNIPYSLSLHILNIYKYCNWEMNSEWKGCEASLESMDKYTLCFGFLFTV